MAMLNLRVRIWTFELRDIYLPNLVWSLFDSRTLQRCTSISYIRCQSGRANSWVWSGASYTYFETVRPWRVTGVSEMQTTISLKLCVCIMWKNKMYLRNSLKGCVKSGVNVIDSLDWSSYLVVNIWQTSEETLQMLCNAKVHYRVKNSPTLILQ